MLPIFLDHYTRFFPEECIYVIDHGARIPTKHTAVNRISVPRDRPFSELDRLNLIKSIAGGLLGYFDWGVVADCDELIAIDHIDEQSLKQAKVMHVAGFEAYRGNVASPAAVLGLLNPAMCKPLIFATLPSWNVGFHLALEVEPLPELTVPMAHVRFLYPDIAAQRATVRLAIPESMPEAERREGMATHWARGGKVLEDFQRLTMGLAERRSAIVPFTAVPRDQVLERSEVPIPGHGKVVFWGARGGYETASMRHDITRPFAHLAKEDLQNMR